MARFFADEGFPHIASEKLRLLGWDISELVIDTPLLRGCDDVTKVLLHAKRTQRILLSSDMFADRDTRVRLWDNIRQTKRGKTLSVGGGPEKPWTQIVGKLLFHYEEWEPFFASGHGIVKVHDMRAEILKKFRPEELATVSSLKVRQGEKYLNRPRQLPLPKPKRPKQPTAGAPLEEVGLQEQSSD